MGNVKKDFTFNVSWSDLNEMDGDKVVQTIEKINHYSSTPPTECQIYGYEGEYAQMYERIGFEFLERGIDIKLIVRGGCIPRGLVLQALSEIIESIKNKVGDNCPPLAEALQGNDL